MARMYGSDGANAGGITFKNGAEFYREWLPVVAASRPLINDEGYALINDNITKYKIFKDNAGDNNWHCVEFCKNGSKDILFAYGEC